MNLIAAPKSEKIEWIRYKQRQFGWQGSLGILLMFGAALLMVVSILPESAELAKLSSEIQKTKATHVKVEQIDPKKERSDVIRSFYALLPLEEDANNKIAEILDAAKVAGLVSNKTEYRLQDVPASACSNYQINMPVLGSYIQIRQFIKYVLNAHPSLALNAINLKRDDVNNEAVEANIQLTLYLKKAKR